MRTRILYCLCTLAAVALISTPTLAAPIDCGNIALSAGMISPDTLAACGGHGGSSRPQLDPTDIAIGLEGIGAECESMVLNNPAGASGFGSLAFHPAADFAGSDFSQLYVASFASPTTISTVDAATCAQTTIGTCTLNSTAQLPSGMAWDDSTGTMYLSSTDITTSQLYTVDLGTGACTFVGSMGAASPGNIAIAVDSSAALGGGGQMYGYDIVNDSLQSIDKTTGAATTIGPLGFDANYAQGMDFDESDGTCYLFAFSLNTFSGELRTCDVSTGNTSLVGFIGPDGFNEWTGQGIMAGGGGCVLHASVPRNLRAGDALPVTLSITHRRPSAVDVPFTLEVRDRRGRIVAAGQTGAIHLEYGQTINASHTLQLPARPGVYTLHVSMPEMRGGTEVTTVQFRVR